MKMKIFAALAAFVFGSVAIAGEKGQAAAKPPVTTATKAADCNCAPATKTVTVVTPLTRREKLRLPLVKEQQVKVVEPVVKVVEVKEVKTVTTAVSTCTSGSCAVAGTVVQPVVRVRRLFR